MGKLSGKNQGICFTKLSGHPGISWMLIRVKSPVTPSLTLWLHWLWFTVLTIYFSHVSFLYRSSTVDEIGMPLLRMCLRGVRFIQKPNQFLGAAHAKVETTASTRGITSASTEDIQTTTTTENSEHTDGHDPERFNRRSAGNFDTIGSWNTRVQMKLNMEQSIKFGKLIPEVSLDNVGVTSLIGRRKENEDRHKILRLAPNLLMFAIFDGHGGPHAADYTSDRMSKHIKFWIERGESNLQTVLKNAFVGVNNAFARQIRHNLVGKLRKFAFEYWFS